jgi:uncharacterized protein (TIGR00288 family)
MASSPESTSMALFCDFENVALGVRDAKYDKFDIKRVLERLLLKGSIVVKKAYCDWDRYKNFKATMHEANFELIEIPHVRQSGKNSADIRLVVDALDLCYTKSHVDTFVIISGDSDFSPLVSKLRENNKQVIGVGVKQSTSDLLIANCDEFIFYDDLVREDQRAAARRAAQEPPAARRQPDDGSRRSNKEDPDAKRIKAIDLVVETLEALGFERGDGGKVRTSVLKDAIKRRRPDFNESYFGFRSFGGLLDEAQARGQLEVVRDEKGNAYVQRAGQGGSSSSRNEPLQQQPQHRVHEGYAAPAPVHAPAPAYHHAPSIPAAGLPPELAQAVLDVMADVVAEVEGEEEEAPAPREAAPRGRSRAGRKTAKKPVQAQEDIPEDIPAAEVESVEPPAPEPVADEAAVPARKSTGRGRRPRKQAVEPVSD